MKAKRKKIDFFFIEIDRTFTNILISHRILSDSEFDSLIGTEHKNDHLTGNRENIFDFFLHYNKKRYGRALNEKRGFIEYKTRCGYPEFSVLFIQYHCHIGNKNLLEHATDFKRINIQSGRGREARQFTLTHLYTNEISLHVWVHTPLLISCVN